MCSEQMGKWSLSSWVRILLARNLRLSDSSSLLHSLSIVSFPLNLELHTVTDDSRASAMVSIPVQCGCVLDCLGALFALLVTIQMYVQSSAAAAGQQLRFV